MEARFASGDQARVDAAFTSGDANRRVPQRLTEAHVLAALQAANGIDIDIDILVGTHQRQRLAHLAGRSPLNAVVA